MAKEYVESREGGLYVAATRVSLASIIYSFRNGDSPETIQQNFPVLSLAEVYGAIAYYLDHPQESEADLRDLEEKWRELEQNGRPPSEDLLKRIEQARQRLLANQR